MKATLLEQLQEKIIHYLSEIKNKNDKIEELKSTVSTLKKEKIRCNNRIKKLQLQANELQDVNQDLKNQLVKLKEDLEHTHR